MKNELLAPNGKPSNLTSAQYKLVRSELFKKWFGDWENDPANASKVVDENGEPLVVYHGTSAKFNIFRDVDVKRSTMGNSVGFYFTPSEWNASRRSDMGDYIKVFLNIKNLVYLKKFSNDYDFISILGEELKLAKGLPDRAETYWFLKNGSAYRGLSDDNVGDVVKALSLKKGIDGYYFSEFMSAEEGVVPVYVVFSSENVKLADGTNTTFDSRNDDIRFENGGRTISQTLSPKKDRIVGSDLNKKSSSKNLSSAKFIKFEDKTLNSIKSKVSEHNDKYPDKKINLASAKAVVRRGMGAYSGSHRPTISGGKPNSRVAWGLARLNAFTYKIVNGKSKSGKYTQDDDLIEELGFKVADYKNGGEMKKDIRCINCGWEWNRKDSELWDMYVCHKCGFDNTSFYTSDPINRLLKGGGLNSVTGVSPDYLKMFLGK